MAAMHPDKRTMAWVNVRGGVAVLGSYAHGLATHPTSRHQLWGGVADAWRSLYTVSMWLAAAGYLVQTAVLDALVWPAYWR